jgi:hypothetical protein
MATVGEEGTSKAVMDQYRLSSYPDKQTAFFAAQVCITNLVRAFSGVISEKRVRKAVGNATTPNAVSRAARARLPHL